MAVYHPYARAVLETSGLVSYWRLDDGIHERATDEAGTQHGTYFDVIRGGAGALNSFTSVIDDEVRPNSRKPCIEYTRMPGQRVEVPHNVAHWLSGGGTIETWIRTRVSDATIQVILAKFGATGYAFYVSSDRKITFQGNATPVNSSVNAIELDTWHHVAATWDADGAVAIYVGGVSVGTGSVTVADPVTPLMIGAIGASLTSDGWQDEVALYNRPLDQTELAAHYALRLEPTPFIGVMIAGIDRTAEPDPIVDGSAGLGWTDQLNGRGELNVTVTDTPVMGFRPLDGHPVIVFEDEVRRFSGNLYEPQEQLSPDRTLMFYQCSAVERSGLCDRFSVLKIYDQTPSQTIVADIVATFMGQEGISIAGVETGPVIERAIFDDISVTQAFNEISELIGYAWWIDEYDVLNFRPRMALAAPATLDLETITSGTLRIRPDREKFRTRQILKGGKALTDPRIEISVGDGTRRVFSTAFPIGAVPTVEVSRNGGPYVGETVGILGVDEGFQWYWNLGMPQISQDESGTVLADTIDRVRVTYRGQFNLKLDYLATAAASARAAIEGGSGIHTHVEIRPEIDDLNQGIQTVFALIDRYAKLGKIIDCETREQGFRSGQIVPVQVIEHGVDAEYLIDGLTANIPPGMREIRYAITALQGDPYGSWQAFFRDLINLRRRFTLEREDESLTVVRSVAAPVLAGVDLLVDATAPESRIGFMTIGRGEIGANP